MHSTTMPPGRQNHDLLQSGLDLLDQGLTVFDAELRLVAWNQAFLRLLDFPPELVFVGAPFDSFMRYNAKRGEYGPGDIEQLVRERVDAARAFEAHYTERHRPDGQIIAVRGGPLPHNGFVALYTDITAQRRYEDQARAHSIELELRVHERTVELQASNQRLIAAGSVNHAVTTALRRSEERLSLITDSVPALIGYFDKDQVYRYVNQRYADWFDRPKDGIVGCSILEVVGERIYRDVRQHIERAIGGAQVSYQYAMARNEGQIVHASSMLVPEFGPDGEVLGCFVLSVDVSELKTIQAALSQAQKMEAVGQLTGGLAHDFNNLLTIVIGNLAALAERGAAPEVEACVTPALAAAHCGAELIKRLLAFARQQPLEPCPVDVSMLAADTRALLQRSFPQNVAISIAPAVPAVFALTDPHQLENALLNLAFNGRDAMPAGGHLHIDIATRTVADRDRDELDVRPGEYVQISVSDDGAGMAEATAAHAFEPFFTTKRFGAGNGLGLSMVYGFAKQSGGGVSIHSVVGSGTTVRLLLPRCAAAPAAPAPDPAAASPGANRRPLVLLVEDNADVRQVLRRQLTELGYPVLEADDGDEAIAMLDSVADIGILISDIVLPGKLNGREIGRRARLSHPHVRVLLISGYPDEPPTPGTGLHQQAVLRKPFSKAMLAEALTRGAA